MVDRLVAGRVSRRRWSPWSGRDVQLDDLVGDGQVELGEDVVLGFGDLGAAAEHAGRSGEGALSIPPKRGGLLYAASALRASAMYRSYSMGDMPSQVLCRRRVL